MHFVPVAWWLENGRVAAQSAWFSCLIAALWVTLGALRWPRLRAFSSAARGLWKGAMALLVVLWLGSATLEMMRRAAPLSGLQLVLALGAFSGLMAGVLSLAREWFGEGKGAPLGAEKIAFSLLILTLAGWWLGGLALIENPCWWVTKEVAASHSRMPEGWALLLGGATLLGASRSVRSSDESVRRARNPRPATWWLAGTWLLLGWPASWPVAGWLGGANPGAASVFGVASAVFGLKVWRARADCPLLGRAPLGVRLVFVLALAVLPWIWDAPSGLEWAHDSGLAWREPHQVAAWLMLALALCFLLTRLRKTLRLAIYERFFDRALLQGALAGWVMASLIFGPGGAIFWVFWPLCGVFCDLLALREPFRNTPVVAASVAADSSTKSRTDTDGDTDGVAVQLPADELAAPPSAP